MMDLHVSWLRTCLQVGFGGKGKGGAKLSFFNSESYILFIQINKGLEYHFISLF